MVNSLSQCSGAEDEPLEEVLRHSVDEKTFQEWTEFISGPVAEQNKKNDIKLVKKIKKIIKLKNCGGSFWFTKPLITLH